MNHVALELQRAHELDVPIIPVTIDGTRLSKDLDLGSINFIYESQFHDISDKQGRWRADVNSLVTLLESVPGMGPARITSTASTQPADDSGRSRLKWLVAVVGLLIVAAVWVGMSVEPDKLGVKTNAPKPVGQTTAVQDDDRDMKSTNSFPNISSTWQAQDGTVYVMQQYEDGTFDVESPGHGTGRRRFSPNLPSKLELEMVDVGRGEFSDSATGDRALGWIIVDGQQQFHTLTRVE